MHHDIKARKRMMRVAALGVVLGIVGIASLIIDWRLRTTRSTALRSSGSVSAPAAPPRQIPLNPFAGYPAPEEFQRLIYDGKTITEHNFIEIGGKCTDTYFTLVLFPAGLDYRDDPTRAAVNRATLCPPEKTFAFRLTAADLRSLPKGEYYVIVADQGATGMWYNPR